MPISRYVAIVSFALVLGCSSSTRQESSDHDQAAEEEASVSMGRPSPPSVEESGLDFEDTKDGKIGWMRVDEESSGLNHAFAYKSNFLGGPCIVLLLTAVELSDEKQRELEEKLKRDGKDTGFYADGPRVQLTLWPSGELLAMNAWIDDLSLSNNRGPTLDIQIDGGRISGKVGMTPEKINDAEFEFQAKFDTSIKF